MLAFLWVCYSEGSLKLCMMIISTKLYVIMLGLATLTHFYGRRSLKKILKVLISHFEKNVERSKIPFWIRVNKSFLLFLFVNIVLCVG